MTSRWVRALRDLGIAEGAAKAIEGIPAFGEILDNAGKRDIMQQAMSRVREVFPQIGTQAATGIARGLIAFEIELTVNRNRFGASDCPLFGPWYAVRDPDDTEKILAMDRIVHEGEINIEGALDAIYVRLPADEIVGDAAIIAAVIAGAKLGLWTPSAFTGDQITELALKIAGKIAQAIAEDDNLPTSSVQPGAVFAARGEHGQHSARNEK